MTRKEFGKMLRRMREAAGITQADLAKALGYGSYQMICNLERGSAKLPPDKIKAVAKLLNVDAKLLARSCFHVEASEFSEDAEVPLSSLIA